MNPELLARLLRIQHEDACKRGAEELAKAGLAPNRWGSLEMNREALRHMGRDAKGAPLPTKGK